MEKIKVMLVDDHEMVRMGLSTYLNVTPDIEVIAEASSGHEALPLLEQHQPDIVLLDLIMEGMDGIETAQRMRTIIKDMQLKTKIIVLTSFAEKEQAVKVIEAGAFSYLLKTSSADEISHAIRKAQKNEQVIEGKVTSLLFQQLQDQKNQRHLELTEREREVLALIGNGLNNKEIGDTLHIGIKTVKTHVSNILSKLGVEDRTQAAIYAVKHKIDQID